jgi:hypothetical protein
MLSGPVYITPTELLTRAPLGSIARSEIPGPQFRGQIGATTHSGASTGVFRFGGYPIDVTPIVARVAVGGDLGVAQFEISTDGGLTFADAVLTETNAYGTVPAATRWTYEISYTGVTILAINGTGTPSSFLAGDTWACTTSASKRLLMVCGELSDYLRKWQENTAQGVTDIDEADRQMICEYGRWKLVAGRGQVPEDWKALAENARKHFQMESEGDINTNAVPSQDGFVFPDYERARAPYRSIWRH